MTPYTEFEVSGHTYRCKMMNALTQLNVYRRLTPLLDAVRVITRGRQPGDVASPVAPEQVQEALGVAMGALGTMPDEQVNYVIKACLELTDRKDGEVWAPLWSAGAGKVMYDDVTVIPMIMICYNVLKGALGPFSLASLTASAPRL